MGDRRFDPNAGFVHGPLQPSLDRAEQDGAQSTPALQRDPIDQVTCRVGDNSCATAHASTINRATALQPGRAKHSLLQLQRQYGNRYVERVLSLAREAGAEHDHVSPEVERAIQQECGGGQPLDGTVRLQMEGAMGADFSAVRVHSGDTSDGLNRALEARAFTTGHDIFFRQGAYQPGSSTGRELLAHELTHVVQQTGSAVRRQMEVSNPGDPHEVEAERMARAVMQRESQAPIGVDEHDKDKHSVPAMGCCSGDEVQRQPEAVSEEEKKKKQLAMRNPGGPGVSRQKEEEQEVRTKRETGFSGNGRVPLPLSVAPPCIQRKAQFVKGKATEEVDPAEQIAENKIPKAELYLGETNFLLNGVPFKEAASPQTMINALNKPQIGQASVTMPTGTPGKTVQGVECWLDSEPVNQGSYQMKLLKQGSWTHVTEKKNVGGRFPSLKKCKEGFGEVNFVVRGEKSDDGLRDRVKAHEKQHADDDEAVFNDLLGTWDKDVTKAYKDKFKTRGSNLTKCEQILYARIAKGPSNLVTNLAQGIVKKSSDFHRTAAGAKPDTQIDSVDPDCTVVKVRTG